MAYDIHIHEEDIVFVRFEGQSDVVENERARREVMRICRDTDIKSVLSDWREAEIHPNVSTMDLHQFGRTWDTSLICRIATVLPTDARNRDNITFSETVANNRGLISNTFDDLEEAIRWLTHQRGQA